MLTELVKDFPDVELEGLKITVKDTISIDDLLKFLDKLYTFERDQNKAEDKKEKKEILDLNLNLRELSTEKLIEAFRYSLKIDYLLNRTMLLNIINLIKTQNTLESDFFENPEIYFKDDIEFLDIKSDLTDEIGEFRRELSIYFISLIKSYSKLEVNFLDSIVPMPSTFGIIITSLDFFSLSSIFNKSEPFDVSECKIIQGAHAYLNYLFTKSQVADNLLNTFMTAGDTNGNSEQ